MSLKNMALCLVLPVALILATGSVQVAQGEDQTIEMVPWIMNVRVDKKMPKRNKDKEKVVTNDFQSQGVLLIEGNHEFLLGSLWDGKKSTWIVSNSLKGVVEISDKKKADSKLEEWLKNINIKLPVKDRQELINLVENKDQINNLSKRKFNRQITISPKGSLKWPYQVNDAPPQMIMMQYLPQLLLQQKVMEDKNQKNIIELQEEKKLSAGKIDRQNKELANLQNNSFPFEFTEFLSAALGLKSKKIPPPELVNSLRIFMVTALGVGAFIIGLFWLVSPLLIKKGEVLTHDSSSDISREIINGIHAIRENLRMEPSTHKAGATRPSVQDMISGLPEAASQYVNGYDTCSRALETTKRKVNDEIHEWGLSESEDMAEALDKLLNHVKELRKEQEALEPRLAILAGVSRGPESNSYPQPGQRKASDSWDPPASGYDQTGSDNDSAAGSAGNQNLNFDTNLQKTTFADTAAVNLPLGGVNLRLMKLADLVQATLRQYTEKKTQGRIEGEASLAWVLSELERMNTRAAIFDEYLLRWPESMQWRWSDSDDRLKQSMQQCTKLVIETQPIWDELSKAPGKQSPLEKLRQYLALKSQVGNALGMNNGGEFETVADGLNKLSIVRSLLESAPTSKPAADDQLREYLDLRLNLANHLQMPDTSTCPSLTANINNLVESLAKVSRNLDSPDDDLNKKDEAFLDNQEWEPVTFEGMTLNQALIGVEEKAKRLKAKAAYWAQETRKGEALLALFNDHSDKGEEPLAAARRILDEVDRLYAELSKFHLPGNSCADWVRELNMQWEKARGSLLREMALKAGTSLEDACQASLQHFKSAEIARLALCDALNLEGGTRFPDVTGVIIKQLHERKRAIAILRKVGGSALPEQTSLDDAAMDVQTFIKKQSEYMDRIADAILQRLGWSLSNSSPNHQNYGRVQLLAKLTKCSLQNLRFILKAASEEIKEGISFAKEQGKEREINVLRTENFVPNIIDFLNDLPVWDLSDSQASAGAPDQLRDLLTNGFKHGWLHFLLRADLICEAYFWDQPALNRVGQGLKAAASALRLALEQAGFKVTPVNLLCLPPGQKEKITHSAGDLGALSAARSKVSQRMNKSAGFVVDISSFPWQHKDIRHPGGLVVVEPIEWSGAV